ncbi:hypothetical protein Forpe1208_v016951 [Fusarium oxysporum f. sp. rapae]|uniref:Uncharacterized protein n=1 Tax=Fusarium oxysporum f. sp. rapae TaxID=485398 RepID=A0A8J5NI35_FUSOX|nr:hypothetical protein Forpe1208_v016951 [Fusarium oxysporum f. sp. rapae]
MASAQLYAMALERSAQPDLPTEHNKVPHGIARLLDTDRIACKTWLQEMNFLCPGEGEDKEVWAKIKRNWIGYLSATSPTPEVALAPNRKVVQFTGGDGDDNGVENARGQKRRFADDRRRRMTIQSAFWNDLDEMEAMTERWPRAARAYQVFKSGTRPIPASAPITYPQPSLSTTTSGTGPIPKIHLIS